MCKLASITGLLPRPVAEKSLDIISSDFIRGQRDGFGFYCLNSNNKKKASGRYLDPDDFIGHRCQLPSFMVNGPIKEYGRIPLESSLIIAHGRTSTNTKTIANVHPFRNGPLVLAHNGILHWTGPKDQEPPSSAGCDSEQFLNWLASGGTWDDACKVWSGWAAILMADLASRSLTIAKDGSTSLHAAKRRGPGWIIATDSNLVRRLAKIIPCRTKPIALPRRIIHFDSNGEMHSDRDWPGIGAAFWDDTTTRSIGFGSSNICGHQVKIVKSKAADEHNSYLAWQARQTQREEAAKLNRAITREAFPDYDPMKHGSWD